MLKKICCFLIAFCFCVQAATAQTFNASVSRTDIPYGETLLLILDYDGNDNSLKPDLSALRQDFTIFSTSQSYSTQIINGKTSSSRQWQIALMPNHSGAIEIPAISLGNLKSNPVALNVFEGNINGQDGTPLYTRFSLDGELDNETPYVQQQINYTLTLNDAGGLQSDAPEFFGNDNNDWVIKSLREPTVENKLIDGVNVREIKFYYAMFPQRSGLLQTPQIQLNGFYVNGQKQSGTPKNHIFGRGFFDTGIDIFDMVAARSPVSLNVKPIKVEVKPIASDFGNSWWLPAKNVSLTAEWADNNPQFMVGQAVSRNISLSAVGVLETQLPDIKTAQTRDMKQYPEKPMMFSSFDSNGDIVSTKEFTNVYIPQKAGKMTVPAISVKWFDTESNTVRTAEIEEQTIIVLPNPQIEQKENYIDYASAENLPEQTHMQPKTAQMQKDTLAHGFMYAMILAAFAAGILISYILFGAKKEKKQELAASVKDMAKYAKEQDFKKLRDALIVWAQKRYNESITDLKAVAEKAEDAEFSGYLEEISQNLYGKSKNEWKHLDFVKALKRVGAKKSKNKKKHSPLPKLYKH